jgi:hypothetical protein
MSLASNCEPLQKRNVDEFNLFRRQSRKYGLVILFFVLVSTGRITN